MGYFVNRCAQAEYRAQFCQHCQHSEGCAVWALHQALGELQVANRAIKDALDRLIPHRGMANGPCTMLLETGESRRPSW